MPISKSALAPLTSVRFLAALRVALYHSVPWSDKGFWWRGLLATPISVSYFFVSSGFLLAYNYSERSDQGQMDSKRFLLGRAARLLPVYFMGLLVAVPLLFQSASDFSLGKTALTVLLLQAWSPSSALYWNFPAWALSNLAFFYTSLPIILKLTRSASKKTCVLVAGLAWAVSVGLALVYMQFNPDGLHQISNHSQGFWLYILKYNPLARLPEFVMGVMAGRLFLLTGGFRRHTSTAVFLCSSLLLLGFLLLGHLIPYPVINSGLLAPVLILVISSLASGGLGADFFKLRWFVLLGQSSFCLYMLHLPLWDLTHRASAFYWNLALVPEIIILSLLLYRWVEVPATTALKSFLLPGSAPAALASDRSAPSLILREPAG
jgi:peptidoglycan/LPS O-acetylase OafA/YrhL